MRPNSKKTPPGPKSGLLSDNTIYPETLIIQKNIETITNGRNIAHRSIKEYF
jgi:hypothetical protein